LKRIVLASNSPRRRELLENLRIPFIVMRCDIEEKVFEDETPEQIVMALAFEKAYEVSKKIEDPAIIIAADTIVFKDKILGKPKDFEDAFSILKMLQGDYHEVFSGLAIIDKETGKKVVTYEKTRVYFKELSDDVIRSYIETGEVWDKAGAYGIQGKGGLFVESIVGDYFNVVGLPISKLYDILYRFFNISLL